MDFIQPGQMLGPYRIIEQIGEGGMAAVFKAYHATMDRYVAVKVLPGELARSPSFRGRFQQEALTIAKLEHAHILPIYDFGESDGIHYFVMRLLDTGTLTQRIEAHGVMSLAEIGRIFLQLAEALGYAHDQGVIHRDIKPSNVMLDARGDVFLTDFGIAKLVEGSPQFTSTGSITGTPAYMSPEQAMGEKVDARSDIYSLGIVLYQMITDHVPFEAETPLAVIIKQMQAVLPPPTQFKADLHPEIEKILLKALAKDRKDRYSSCKEFGEAWEAAMIAAAAPPQTAQKTNNKAPKVVKPKPPITVQKKQPSATIMGSPGTYIGEAPFEKPKGNLNGIVIALVGVGVLGMGCLALVFGGVFLNSLRQANALTPAVTVTATVALVATSGETAVPTVQAPTTLPDLNMTSTAEAQFALATSDMLTALAPASTSTTQPSLTFTTAPTNVPTQTATFTSSPTSTFTATTANTATRTAAPTNTSTRTAPPPTATQPKPTATPVSVATQAKPTATTGVVATPSGQLIVDNAFGGDVRVQVSGPSPKSFTIGAGQRFTLAVSPGAYSVQVSNDACPSGAIAAFNVNPSNTVFIDPASNQCGYVVSWDH